MEDLKVYTVEEVANLLQVTRRTVYDYIKQGKLNATKIGKYWRITDKDIKNMFNQSNQGTIRSNR